MSSKLLVGWLVGWTRWLLDNFLTCGGHIRNTSYCIYYHGFKIQTDLLMTGCIRSYHLQCISIQTSFLSTTLQHILKEDFPSLPFLLLFLFQPVSTSLIHSRVVVHSVSQILNTKSIAVVTIFSPSHKTSCPYYDHATHKSRIVTMTSPYPPGHALIQRLPNELKDRICNFVGFEAHHDRDQVQSRPDLARSQDDA